MTFHFNQLSSAEQQHYLYHIVGPRPICFASTIDRNGTVNLSPFSFFNIFSFNPPIVIFSPLRRVRNNTIKHTLENVMEVPEVVINIVSYDIVHQASLASCEYEKGVDEFAKAGFTKEAATVIAPPMVKESRTKMECKVIEIKSLGAEGGAGQLVLCEVLALHIDDAMFNAENKIDQTKLDLVARLGGDMYCRVTKENIFEIPKPNAKVSMGIDGLPEHIRYSSILSGKHLALLANTERVPGIDKEMQQKALCHFDPDTLPNPKEGQIFLHCIAKKLIDAGKVNLAWQILLPDGQPELTEGNKNNYSATTV